MLAPLGGQEQRREYQRRQHQLGELETAAQWVVEEVAADAGDAEASYDYPGNIRELKNTIERRVILMANDLDTDAAQVFPFAQRGNADSLASADPVDAIVRTVLDEKFPVQMFENQLLKTAALRYEGNLGRLPENDIPGCAGFWCVFKAR
jgi:DNA-binding NtrC family response regulator